MLKYDGDTLLKSVTGFDLPSPAIRTLAIDKHDVLWMNYYERNTGGNNPRLIGFDGNQVIKNIEAPHTTSNLLYNSFAVDYNDTLFGSGLITILNSMETVGKHFQKEETSILLYDE